MKMDIAERLTRIARGDHPDLADLVCADALAELNRLRQVNAGYEAQLGRFVSMRQELSLNNYREVETWLNDHYLPAVVETEGLFVLTKS